MPLTKLDLDRTNPDRVRQGRRRRSPKRSHNNSPPPRPAKTKTLVMGEVKLLRRGEELKGTVLKSAAAEKLAESDRSRAESLGGAAPARNLLVESEGIVGPAPEPVTQPKGATAESVRVAAPTLKGVTEPVSRLVDLYAGGAFVNSPPPSSLPMPAFCAKKTDRLRFVDATNDLRKLLRLV